MIYRYVLKVDGGLQRNQHARRIASDDQLTALLRADHQISEEAARIFYNINSFRFTAGHSIAMYRPWHKVNSTLNLPIRYLSYLRNFSMLGEVRLDTSPRGTCQGLLNTLDWFQDRPEIKHSFSAAFGLFDHVSKTAIVSPRREISDVKQAIIHLAQLMPKPLGESFFERYFWRSDLTWRKIDWPESSSYRKGLRTDPLTKLALIVKLFPEGLNEAKAIEACPS